MMIARANSLAEENKDYQSQAKGRQKRLTELEANGLEVSDEELAKIISLFQSGQGNRFALADRIRAMVERIDVKSDGAQIPDWVDPDVAAAMVDGGAKNPRFTVKLKNRDAQIVLVDRNNPTTILQTLAMDPASGETKYHLMRDQELDVSIDLIDRLK